MSPTTDTGTDVVACCSPLGDHDLSEQQALALAPIFAALADPVRLRMLSLIASVDEVCSCSLEAPLGKSQPTISHHTKILHDAGLITGERRGRWMWWRADTHRLEAVAHLLVKVSPISTM